MSAFSLELFAGYSMVTGALIFSSYLAVDALRRWHWQRRQLRRVMEHYQQQALPFSSERRQRSVKELGSWEGHRKFRVTRKVPETKFVSSFYLAPHDGGALTEFSPGQYLTFSLRASPRSAPLVRCYSLSGLPTQNNEYRISVKREGREDADEEREKSASCFFHDRAQEGSIVDVRSPSGDFTLDCAAGRPVVFIAGGVGLTPFLAMCEYLAKHDPEREAWLFYGVPNRDFEVMPELLREWDKRPNFHLVTCYSQPQSDDADECIERSQIDLDLLRRHLLSSNYEFFTCAPAGMIAAVNEGLREWGVPDSSIHFENFKGETVAEAGRTNPALEGLEPCVVSFRSAGKALEWKPEAGTLLDLATAGDVFLPSGCRVGKCGSCATPVMKGEFRYLKEPEFPVAKDSCLACVAVPVGDAELA